MVLQVEVKVEVALAGGRGPGAGAGADAEVGNPHQQACSTLSGTASCLPAGPRLEDCRLCLGTNGLCAHNGHSQNCWIGNSAGLNSSRSDLLCWKANSAKLFPAFLLFVPLFRQPTALRQHPTTIPSSVNFPRKSIEIIQNGWRCYCSRC